MPQPNKQETLMFDSELNFKTHMGHVTKSAFYHIKNIAEVQPFLSLSNTEKLIVLLSLAVDYCNARFYGLL